MSKSRLISGIEVGSSSVVTLIAQVQDDEFSPEKNINIIGVASAESKGIKKGQIVDIDEAVETILQSVEAAERMAGCNIDSAFVAVGGAHILSQNSHGVVAVSDPNNEIKKDDVDRVIEAASAVALPASRSVVHVMPKEFVVDGEAGIKDPAGMSGVRLEVDTHIITASMSAIKNLRKAISEVGIEVEGLVYSGLAAAESCLTETERELGCLLVDIGGGTTSVVVFVDGALSHSFVIPIGAKNITNDIAIGMRTSIEQAEKIKLSLSDDNHNKMSKNTSPEIPVVDDTELQGISKKTLIDGIIRPRINEIFTMIRMQLESDKVFARIPSGLILTGGGSETVSVLECARKTISLPVKIGVPKGIGGLIDDIIKPSYAVPIGLIIYGSKIDHKNISKKYKGKIKIGSSGLFGKVFDTIKELLP